MILVLVTEMKYRLPQITEKGAIIMINYSTCYIVLTTIQPITGHWLSCCEYVSGIDAASVLKNEVQGHQESGPLFVANH